MTLHVLVGFWFTVFALRANAMPGLIPCAVAPQCSPVVNTFSTTLHTSTSTVYTTSTVTDPTTVYDTVTPAAGSSTRTITWDRTLTTTSAAITTTCTPSAQIPPAQAAAAMTPAAAPFWKRAAVRTTAAAHFHKDGHVNINTSNDLDKNRDDFDTNGEEDLPSSCTIMTSVVLITGNPRGGSASTTNPGPSDVSSWVTATGGGNSSIPHPLTPTPSCFCGSTTTRSFYEADTVTSPGEAMTETPTITATQTFDLPSETVDTTVTVDHPTYTAVLAGDKQDIDAARDTYLAQDKETFYTYGNVDFPSGDQDDIVCDGSEASNATFPDTDAYRVCNSFEDCMEICTMVNRYFGAADQLDYYPFCMAVSYTPNGVGTDPPRCRLKDSMFSGQGQCGVVESYRVDSAILEIHYGSNQEG